MEEFLRAENLKKVYGKGRNTVFALKGVSFEIKKGDFVCLLGPSGSGKTTLLNLIGCLDRPTEGKIFFEKKEITSLPENKLAEFRQKKIGFVFQFFYLIPTLNVLQNVLVPTFPIRNGPKKYLNKARKLLKRVGLEKMEKRYPHELSGGEQQRTAIARALIFSPPLVLADEPTGNLDTKTGMEIIKLMKELQEKENITFIIATHDIRIKDLATKVFLIEDGKIKNG